MIFTILQAIDAYYLVSIIDLDPITLFLIHLLCRVSRHVATHLPFFRVIKTQSFHLTIGYDLANFRIKLQSLLEIMVSSDSTNDWRFLTIR